MELTLNSEISNNVLKKIGTLLYYYVKLCIINIF